MTGDAQKFSHISVASDDEDDVVIEAGAPRFRSYGEGESAAQPAGDEVAASAANKTSVVDGGEGFADRARRIHRVLRGVHGLEGPVTCEEIERYRNAETHWKSNRRQRRSGDAQGRGRSLERHRIDPGVRAHRR